MSLRHGVVAVFREPQGKILLFERSDRPGIWQFPQGGVEEGESEEEALVREVREEIGAESLRILRKAERATQYYWPPGTLSKKQNEYVGQEHSWFLVEFEGSDRPHLETGDGSFTRFEWFEPARVIERNIDWKRPSMTLGLQKLGLL